MPPCCGSAAVLVLLVLCSALVAAQLSTTTTTTNMPSTTASPLPNETSTPTSTPTVLVTTQSPSTSTSAATTTVLASTSSPVFLTTTSSPATTVTPVTTTTVAPPPGFSSPPSSAGALSPLYADLVPFSNADAASLVATVLSGISGHPLTSCHVWRTVTLLTVCRGTSTSPLSSSSVPIALAVGSRPETRYYAGASYLNCALFAAIALLTAIASLILAKAKGRSWRRMCVVGHYPQHLLFPFFYFFQTGISTSTTVVVFDDDVTRRVFSGLTYAFWAGLPCAACAVLYSQVHLKAMFVKRFRDVSQEAEVEKVLFRRLVELEKENEEHERRAAKLRMEAEREAQRLARKGAGDDAKSTVTSAKEEPQGAAGVSAPGAGDTVTETDGGTEMTSITRVEGGIGALTGFSLRKLFNTNFIPEAEEDELMRNTEKYLDAAVRADDAEKERLRRATNLVYSKMLASQIQATAFDDSAVQQTLVGRDRWEDREETPGPDGSRPESMLSPKEQQEDDDFLSLEQQAKFAVFVPAPIADYLTSRVSTGAVAVSRTGYLNMWGGFFKGFHESSFMFIALEFFVSFCAGLLDGWKPSDALGSSCYVQASLLFVLYGGYFTAIVILRPYLVPLEAGLVFITSCLLTVGGALLVAAVVNSSTTAAVAANVLAVACIYLFVLKSLLDVFTMLAPFLYAHERPWPTAKLTEYYFDTARETSDASFYEKKQLLRDQMAALHRSSSRHEDSSSTKSPRRSRAGSMQSTSHQARSTSPGKLIAAGSILGGGGDGRNVSPPSGVDQSQPGSKSRVEGVATAPNTASTTSPGGTTTLNYRVVDVIENEAVRYRSIGGRRNAYVTSRGVPEALHPFHLVPLPGIIPLPPRDPIHMTLRQRRAKLAADRSRAVFGAKMLDTSSFLPDDEAGGDEKGAEGGASGSGSQQHQQTWSRALDFLKEEQDRHENRQRQREANRLSAALVGLSRGEGVGSASFGSSTLTRTATAVDRLSAGKTSSGGAGSAVGAAASTLSAPLTMGELLDLEDDPLTITDMLMVRRGLAALRELPSSGGTGLGGQRATGEEYSPLDDARHSSNGLPSPVRSESRADDLRRTSGTALGHALPKGFSAVPPQAHAPHVLREALGQRVVSLLRVTGTGVDADSVEALKSAGARRRRMSSQSEENVRQRRGGASAPVWSQALPVGERRHVHFASSHQAFSSGSPSRSGFSVEL